MNHRRYLCPVCFSAYQDRLYKLYFDRFLRPDGVRRVLEFAPSAPLSAYLRSRADLQHRTADLMMAGVDDVVDIAGGAWRSWHHRHADVCRRLIRLLHLLPRPRARLGRPPRPERAVPDTLGILKLVLCPQGLRWHNPRQAPRQYRRRMSVRVNVPATVLRWAQETSSLGADELAARFPRLDLPA